MHEYRTRQGSHASEEGEMMWQGEFYEFWKRPKMGYLSQQEAEALWEQYEGDANLPKDNRGPRGFLRASEEKVLQRSERLGKDPKAAALDLRMQMLTDGETLSSRPLRNKT
eukprot:2166914-Amphidinium_carterae.1